MRTRLIEVLIVLVAAGWGAARADWTFTHHDATSGGKLAECAGYYSEVSGHPNVGSAPEHEVDCRGKVWGDEAHRLEAWAFARVDQTHSFEVKWVPKEGQGESPDPPNVLIVEDCGYEFMLDAGYGDLQGGGQTWSVGAFGGKFVWNGHDPQNGEPPESDWMEPNYTRWPYHCLTCPHASTTHDYHDAKQDYWFTPTGGLLVEGDHDEYCAPNARIRVYKIGGCHAQASAKGKDMWKQYQP
jgi:hypothetical protein